MTSSSPPPPAARVTSKSEADRISVELSSRRTGMSFQRTRMSADRTLMSVIRTSLSLIGFGFTIFQVFQKLHEASVLKSSGARAQLRRSCWSSSASRMLIIGIVYHVAFMIELRRERERLKADGLIHAESQLSGVVHAADGDRAARHRHFRDLDHA